MYDKEYYTKSALINTSSFQDKKLGFRAVNDCYVLPFTFSVEDGCGIFEGGGTFIKGTSLWHAGSFEAEYENLSTLAEKRKIDISSVPHKKQTAVFAGTLLPMWGHFISDCTRLLWFLRSKQYAEKFSQCPVIYLCDKDSKLSDNHKRILEILGIDFSRLTPVTEPTKYDQIILPDECFFSVRDEARFFTSEYIEMADCIREHAILNAKPVKSDKVYFSYSKYKRNNVIGEDKLEKYFASKGYEIIYPEGLTLDEQLNLLVNAKSFASTVGSCSHNVIFLRDNTEVILIPRHCYINPYQYALNKVHPLNVHYVDSSFSVFLGVRGDKL